MKYNHPRLVVNWYLVARIAISANIALNFDTEKGTKQHYGETVLAA